MAVAAASAVTPLHIIRFVSIFVSDFRSGDFVPTMLSCYTRWASKLIGLLRNTWIVSGSGLRVFVLRALHSTLPALRWLGMKNILDNNLMRCGGGAFISIYWLKDGRNFRPGTFIRPAAQFEINQRCVGELCKR
jgi:hypothetical protein